MNSCAIGLHWLGECTGAADEVYGSAKPGLLLLERSVAVSLASALSWLPILQHWQDVDSQHDAAGFFTFLIEQAGPVAFNGIWESRTLEAGHMRIFDSGPLSVPIPLPLAGSSLQACVDERENQATPHALRFDHGVLILQLRRYGVANGEVHKNQCPIHILPGQDFGMPVFLANDSLERTMHQYRVVFVIYHLGNSVLSGHYMTGLSVPARLLGLSAAQWKFTICDDNGAPTRATARDIQLISENSYIVGAVRSQE